MVYMYSIRIREFFRGLYGRTEHVDPLKLSKLSKHVKRVEHVESVRLSQKLSLTRCNAWGGKRIE